MNIRSREEFTLCDALYAQHSAKWEEKRHPILEEWEESCIYYASEHTFIMHQNTFQRLSHSVTTGAR